MESQVHQLQAASIYSAVPFRPFDYAHGRPFDYAHGRPFDYAHGRLELKALSRAEGRDAPHSRF